MFNQRVVDVTSRIAIEGIKAEFDRREARTRKLADKGLLRPKWVNEIYKTKKPRD